MEVDREIALMKAKAMNLGLDTLTPEQEAYCLGTGGVKNTSGLRPHTLLKKLNQNLNVRHLGRRVGF
jgi:hypothetical protein